MAHIQYSLANSHLLPLPANLLYITSSVYDKDWVSLYHSHSFSELFYVLDGEGAFCAEEERIPLKKDTMIIINPNVRHTETSSEEYPMRYIVLGIDNLAFHFADSETRQGYHTIEFQSHRQTVLPILQSMLEEVRQNLSSYDQICQNFMTILLLRISRITNDRLTVFTPEDLPAECTFIKEYLDTHYQDNITLDHLAEVVHRNKFYLSHMFTDAYGISPINYLLERRILHSKELLRNSDFSLMHIAQATGFSSYNYFMQTFKKKTYMTPRKYRIKHDN